MLGMVYNPTTTIPSKFINLLHNLEIPQVKLVIELMGVNRLQHLQAERNSQICFDTMACGHAEVHV